MAQFDIISATTRAYRVCWDERRYILRLAMFPLLIKLVCFTFAASFARGDDMTLRFSLLMLPAYFAEGWMLAHFTRLLVFDHRWPFRPSGNREADYAALSERARGVLAGMIVFVLINLALGLITALALRFMAAATGGGTIDPNSADLPPGLMLVTLLMLAFTLWGFRLLWLYIPFALNMRAGDYLRALKGFMSSVHLICIWLLCSLPFFLFVQTVSGAMKASAAAGSSAFLLFVLTAAIDTAKNLLATAGITFAVMRMMNPPQRGPRL